MLPDFPKLKAERFDVLRKAAYSRSLRKHPILPEMRFSKQHEGEAVRLYDVNGTESMSGYETFESGLEVTVTELAELDDSKWLVKLEKMTDDFANGQMRLLLKRVSEAATASGNVVSADNKPLSEELILEVFEKIDFDFDGDRVAPGFAFLAAPDMAQRLATLGTSEEFKQKHDRLIEHKRLSFRLRQADRKLVD